MNAAKPPTLIEVARLAGVSLTTASKAVNGRDRISEVTRRRVLRAAKELSYAPNLVAKSLARGQSSIVGVLLRDPKVHRFAMPIVIGAQSVLEQRDFSAIIADARGVVERFADLVSSARRAGRAAAEDRKVMRVDREAELGLRGSCEAFEHFVGRLDRRAALLTDEMGVRVRGELIRRRSVTEMRMHDHAELLQLLEIAIDRREVHVG